VEKMHKGGRSEMLSPSISFRFIAPDNILAAEKSRKDFFSFFWGGGVV
jgi:hypothetical protein